MRCKYCNARLEQHEYGFDPKAGDFKEKGNHADGACLDAHSVDHMFEDEFLGTAEVSDGHDSGEGLVWI